MNVSKLNHTKRNNKIVISLFKLERGNLIGEEDLINGLECYNT
jgi:hypothetical protein